MIPVSSGLSERSCTTANPLATRYGGSTLGIRTLCTTHCPDPRPGQPMERGRNARKHVCLRGVACGARDNPAEQSAGAGVRPRYN